MSDTDQSAGIGPITARLTEHMKAAMRSGDTGTRDTVRYLLSGLKNSRIANGGSLDEAEEEAALSRQAKQYRQSIEQFEAAGRQDLVDKETAQLRVLERYLPAEMDDAELTATVTAVINDVGATGMSDMKTVMPAALSRVGDRANGKRVNEAVRAALSNR